MGREKTLEYIQHMGNECSHLNDCNHFLQSIHKRKRSKIFSIHPWHNHWFNHWIIFVYMNAMCMRHDDCYEGDRSNKFEKRKGMEYCNAFDEHSELILIIFRCTDSNVPWLKVCSLLNHCSNIFSDYAAHKWPNKHINNTNEPRLLFMLLVNISGVCNFSNN